MKNYIFTAVLLFLTISLSAQPIPKYKDASQPIEVRVQDLLSRMTIEEKVAQLRHIHEGSILNDDHTLNLEKMKMGKSFRKPLSAENILLNGNRVMNHIIR